MAWAYKDGQDPSCSEKLMSNVMVGPRKSMNSFRRDIRMVWRKQRLLGEEKKLASLCKSCWMKVGLVYYRRCRIRKIEFVLRRETESFKPYTINFIPRKVKNLVARSWLAKHRGEKCNLEDVPVTTAGLRRLVGEIYTWCTSWRPQVTQSEDRINTGLAQKQVSGSWWTWMQVSL